MTWLEQVNDNPIAWLLEPESPGVRYLALRDLAGLPRGDPELAAAQKLAHTQGPIATVLAAMQPAGYWVKPGPGYSPKYRSTVWAMILLGQLGASARADERVARACGYVLNHALAADGQFTHNGAPGGTYDCLQGNLSNALLDLGCSDPRLEKAMEWAARTVTGEGLAAPDDRQAAVRYTAYKCGPLFRCGANDRLPCAWGAVKIMLAFAKRPKERRTPLIQRAIEQGAEFLLNTDPATAAYPTPPPRAPGGVFSFRNTDPATAAYPTRPRSKPNAGWWKFGFPVFGMTDVLQNAEALARLGYGHDPRLANALRLVLDKQDEGGRWPLEYDYEGRTWLSFGPTRQPNKWVTLRALNVLKAAG